MEKSFEVFAKMMIEEECVQLNNAEHDEKIKQDADGNLGDYRLASHDGAEYSYLSDWYGNAMCSGDVPESIEELRWVLNMPEEELRQRWMQFMENK